VAYSLGNKCAKNCCKRTVLVQLIVKDVTCFFGTQLNIWENVYLITVPMTHFRACMKANDCHFKINTKIRFVEIGVCAM